MQIEDLAFVAIASTLLVFLLLCVVLGKRRWAYIREQNAANLALAREAVADRKKILVVLEELKTILQDRKS